jgi:hypothetical protein
MLYPLINGKRYSFASIELNFNGLIFLGFKEISYSDDLEPGEIRGTHPQMLARTIGDYKAEASASMYMEEYNTLIASMGDGFMEQPFDVNATYADDGQPTVTDRVVGCRIKKNEYSHSQGTDGLIVKVDLHPFYVIHAGKMPLRRMRR